MKKNYRIKKRKGVALIWMILAFTILMILMTSIIYIVRQDIFETVKQEERLQTYYIALAGLDLTYAALMDPSISPKIIDNVIDLLKKSNTSITDTINIEIGGNQKGTATVTIDRVKENEINWVRITAVGQLKDKDTKISSTMRINESNYNQMIREKIGQ